MQEVAQRVPVMTRGAPQDPTPQTVCGTLSQDGQMSLPMQMTGGFMDLPECMSLWQYFRTVTINTLMGVNYEITKFNVWGTPAAQYTDHWRRFAKACGEFWTAKQTYRFWLVKPPRVVGRITIRYHMNTRADDAVNTDTADGAFRMSTIEWDLAQSDYIDVTFPQYRRFDSVPTRRLEPYKNSSAGDAIVLNPTDYFCDLGSVVLNMTSPLKPGTLFPDDYDLVIFRRYEDAVVSAPADFRGYSDYENGFILGIAE